jgi:adenylylsulfate kinase
VECDLATCEQRDPKGLYKKARAGEISNFTGISDPFEAPTAEAFRVNSSQFDVNECVIRIAEELIRI